MDIVTLTIDGRQLSVPKGTSVLKAAIEAGIQVPYYCYHPGLGIDASCRVCLVKIEKMPKLQTSCSTPVAEGMVVHTQDPEAVDGRKGVFEFLLDQPPARLPGVRQGRRVPAAGFLVRVRQRRKPHGLPAPHVRRRGRQGRRRLRPDADAEPQSLHPLHALQPLHGGSRRRRADRHHQPRQRQRDRDVQRAGRALAPLGQPDGRVPGRRHHHAGSIDSARARGTTRTPSTPPARCARRAAAPPRGSRPSRNGRRARAWRASRRATTRRSTTSGCATSAASSTCGSRATSACASR